MAVDLSWLIPGTTRVVVPGGARGTVVRVSPTLRRAPVLVEIDNGGAKAFGPEQLILVVDVAAALGQARP